MEFAELFGQAIKLTVVGTMMVFAVLAIFYGLIKLLLWVFPGGK